MKKILPIILSILVLTSLAVSMIYANPSKERASPSDTINPDQIKVYKDKVVIAIEGAEWAEYTDSNSMEPIIDSGANGIVIAPRSESELNVGDIVSYQLGDDLVVHRIVGIDRDELGTFYIMKGDNNSSADLGKVRFNQIKYKTIAIIY